MNFLIAFSVFSKKKVGESVLAGAFGWNLGCSGCSSTGLYHGSASKLLLEISIFDKLIAFFSLFLHLTLHQT